ncbi:hypothetical protein OUZ56_021570 [Daphnia magna]|uniref:Uncharacterized protein n=1 Tax=Daphnia magna TaxID=35525 RepID=A0ABR0ATX1_9CRUS|nr:hypothetical protein OUZ56_021570 [Daphnia magna]
MATQKTDAGRSKERKLYHHQQPRLGLPKATANQFGQMIMLLYLFLFYQILVVETKATGMLFPVPPSTCRISGGCSQDSSPFDMGVGRLKQSDLMQNLCKLLVLASCTFEFEWTEHDMMVFFYKVLFIRNLGANLFSEDFDGADTPTEAQLEPIIVTQASSEMNPNAVSFRPLRKKLAREKKGKKKVKWADESQNGIYAGLAAVDGELTEPSDYEDALESLQSSQWLAAMEEEIDSLSKIRT